MSASKARLLQETITAKQKETEYFYQLVRLLTYVHNMQTDYPDLPWPDYPDQYSEMTWRYAA